MKEPLSIAPLNSIRSRIYTIRGEQVMLDGDLAEIYSVETKVFNQAVKRNIERFPQAFRFQLSAEEYEELRSQSATPSSGGALRSQFVTLEKGGREKQRNPGACLPQAAEEGIPRSTEFKLSLIVLCATMNSDFSDGHLGHERRVDGVRGLRLQVGRASPSGHREFGARARVRFFGMGRFHCARLDAAPFFQAFDFKHTRRASVARHAISRRVFFCGRTRRKVSKEKMPRLVAELHGQFAESAKLEQAIKANLPARRSAQLEGGRGLGYGG